LTSSWPKTSMALPVPRHWCCHSSFSYGFLSSQLSLFYCWLSLFRPSITWNTPVISITFVVILIIDSILVTCIVVLVIHRYHRWVKLTISNRHGWYTLNSVSISTLWTEWSLSCNSSIIFNSNIPRLDLISLLFQRLKTIASRLSYLFYFFCLCNFLRVFNLECLSF